MKMLRKFGWLRQLVLGVSCLLLVIACNGGGTDTGTGSGDSFQVATEPGFPPFEMQGDDGELTGFDIELMRAIGEEAGLDVQFDSLPFDGIVPALQAQTVDAAISGMTITQERSEVIDFSRPYFKAGLAIAVQEDNEQIKSFDDLEDKKIAVQIGTTGAAEAEKVPGAQISTFDSAPLALQELVNGNVDAVINDAPVTLYAIQEGNLDSLEVAGERLTEEYYGIALPQDSPNLEAVNTALGTLIENGTYAEIYQKWFGGEPPQLPETAPALE